MGFMRSSVAFLRLVELVGGIGTALLGLGLSLYLILEDSAHGRPIESWIDLLGPLMLVFPGIIIGAGSYFQSVRNKWWGVALVVLGSACNLFLVTLNASLNYVLLEDKRGQRIVRADFIFAAIAFGTALINTVVLDRFGSKSE